MSIKSFSVKQLQDCKALVTSLEFGDKQDLLAQIKAGILSQYRSQSASQGSCCPYCGGVVLALGCKGQRCTDCGHQWIKNWAKTAKFGKDQ